MSRLFVRITKCFNIALTYAFTVVVVFLFLNKLIFHTLIHTIRQGHIQLIRSEDIYSASEDFYAVLLNFIIIEESRFQL